MWQWMQSDHADAALQAGVVGGRVETRHSPSLGGPQARRVDIAATGRQ